MTFDNTKNKKIEPEKSLNPRAGEMIKAGELLLDYCR